ncbi:acetylcholine receptor subunit alpha-1-B-like [Ptychodera flava]|uniref:acetylcholine receptor subunit alpha-1-B-like n=1 Tax=Ptychodera flava TaxID=63121 RepID=UPI00396A136B
MATVNQMLHTYTMWAFLLLMIGGTATSTQANISAQQRLMGDLMQYYNRILRPVFNASTVTTLVYGLALMQVIDVDEKNLRISLSVWLRQEWTDEFLRWNPADYDGIEVIRWPASLIWTPDIVLYNNVNDDFPEPVPTNALIHYDGSINWNVPMIFKCYCNIISLDYPFDNQKCDIVFGSWTYDIKEIDLHGKGDSADLSVYLESGEWILNGAPVRREVKHFNCCDVSYVRLIMTVDITRKPMYFLLNMLLPNVIIAFITVWGFFLPPGSGERTSLFITTFLSLIVFQQLVVNSIPPTSDHTPLISRYLTLLTLMVGLSCCLTIIVLHLYHHSAHVRPVPDWLFNLTQYYLSPCLCMGRQNKRSKSNNDVKSSVDSQSYRTNRKICWRKRSYNIRREENYSGPGSDNEERVDEQPKLPKSPAKEKLDAILECIEYLCSIQSTKQKKNESLKDWVLVTSVIDRIILIIVILLLATSTVAFLSR